MNKLPEILTLNYQEPDRVIFIKGFNVADKDWSKLLHFWNNGAPFNEKNNIYSTRIEDYLTRRQWFSINWVNAGLKVEVTEDLRAAVNKTKIDKLNFENALKNVSQFDISGLKEQNLRRKPTREQLSNISASLNILNGANFSVPGAGKTMTTLVIWNHLMLEGNLEKLLIVCPKSAFEAWSDIELEETFINPPKSQIYSASKINTGTQVLITNYEKLENDTQLQRLLRWAEKNKIMLVIDEAHRIKGGNNSVRWRSCRRLSEIAIRVEILTGTPMPQGFDDLRNLFKVSWTNLPTSYLSDAKLNSLNPGSVFVRTTKDKLNLPPFQQKEVMIEMSDVQKQIYSALKRSYAGDFLLNITNEKELARRGRAVMTLIAAASNPGLIAGKELEDAYLNLNWPPKSISKDKDLMDLIQHYVAHEIPPKYDWTLKFIEQSSRQNKKTLIWSNFVGNLRSIKRLLSRFSPALIYGAVNRTDRKFEIKRFREDPNCHVLLTNPQTLGEGISFHKHCHQAIYIDRTYNAGQYLQSLDRIHRLGLPEDTLTEVTVLSSRTSIDNQINTRLQQKISRMANMLNDSSLQNAATLDYEDADENVGSLGLDVADLSNLYRHLVNEEY